MRRGLLLVAALVTACTAVPLPHEGTYHPSDADLAVTRILHGSLVLDLSKTTVLVDPWFHSSLWKRQTEPLGLTPEHLPAIAAVLITNQHAGHFDAEALAEIAKRTPHAIAPPSLADRLRDLGFDVTALDWWADTTIGPVRVTAVPAGRSGHQNGYVLATDRVRVYVADDTHRPDGLVDIATAFPDLDVAFVPIGGRRLMGLARTMGPHDAAKAAALLKPRRVVPIDYGAAGGFPFVWYASDPVAGFREAAAAEGLAPERVVVLDPGESWHYYR